MVSSWQPLHSWWEDVHLSCLVNLGSVQSSHQWICHYRLCQVTLYVRHTTHALTLSSIFEGILSKTGSIIATSRLMTTGRVVMVTPSLILTSFLTPRGWWQRSTRSGSGPRFGSTPSSTRSASHTMRWTDDLSWGIEALWLANSQFQALSIKDTVIRQLTYQTCSLSEIRKIKELEEMEYSGTLKELQLPTYQVPKSFFKINYWPQN